MSRLLQRRPTATRPLTPRRAQQSILLAVTVDKSVPLLHGFPSYLSRRGWTVHLVSSGGPLSQAMAEPPGVLVHTIAMRRGIAPLDDARALLQWVRLLHRLQPDVLYVGTPKAGLLGCVAGMLTRIPRRVYLLRGLRSETLTGASSVVARQMERVAVRCAHEVVCVSPSLRRAAVEAGVLTEGEGIVLGAGSSNGVRADRRPVPYAEKVVERGRYFERPGAFTLGFVGRITPDKGLDTLAAALALLTERGLTGNCLIVGGDDCREAGDLRIALDDSGWAVSHVGQVADTAATMSVLDVLCLPSRREGFPNVVLEAAVLGIPCVGSDATGMADAVVDGSTGLMFRTGDHRGLAEAISTLMADPARQRSLGDSARRRAVHEFDRARVWAVQAEFLDAAAAGSMVGASLEAPGA